MSNLFNLLIFLITLGAIAYLLGKGFSYLKRYFHRPKKGEIVDRKISNDEAKPDFPDEIPNRQMHPLVKPFLVFMAIALIAFIVWIGLGITNLRQTDLGNILGNIYIQVIILISVIVMTTLILFFIFKKNAAENISEKKKMDSNEKKVTTETTTQSLKKKPSSFIWWWIFLGVTVVGTVIIVFFRGPHIVTIIQQTTTSQEQTILEPTLLYGEDDFSEHSVFYFYGDNVNQRWYAPVKPGETIVIREESVNSSIPYSFIDTITRHIDGKITCSPSHLSGAVARNCWYKVTCDKPVVVEVTMTEPK